MPGGLLNIVAYGNQNVILTGNPSKTFFKCAYAKYTNFGLQKFRIDFDGQRNLRLNESSTFTFKVPRYADLLMDTYLSVNLPTIWSPVLPPSDCSGQWRPYEFKWIDNLGTQMIKEINFRVGGQLIQKFTGQYLYNLVERDFSDSKKKLYYEMTGNTSEFNDPANYGGRNGYYPNAWMPPNPTTEGVEPSIRGKTIYIPINIWFTLASQMAFPLVSLQYNLLEIEVIMRPVRELFLVRDVLSCNCDYNDAPYIQANQNISEYQFYRFIQQPPNSIIRNDSYIDKRSSWNANIHLISTYAFLTDDEIKVFASKEQKYLIKEIYEYRYDNVTGTHKVELDSLGLIANWMWFFQRDDVNLRNGWSNYTNWEYKDFPQPLVWAEPSGYETTDLSCTAIDCSNCFDIGPQSSSIVNGIFGPGTQPGGLLGGSNIKITGNYSFKNQKQIMQTFGILLDGKYRENMLPAGIYNQIEKYIRTSGNSSEELNFYNFGLQSDPFDFQPSGAINLSKFKNIQFEFTTFMPPFDPSANFVPICPDNIVGEDATTYTPIWTVYNYNYNLFVYEERYNVLTFTSGNAALMYAR